MGDDRKDLTGVPFFKMTGSGNDFVFLDGRVDRLRALETTEAIQRLCARGTGLGADGVVWLLPGEGEASYRMRYRNSDGSVADMCGNASLCSVALAVRLGLAPGDRVFEFQSDAGVLHGQLGPDGTPEVRLTAIRGLTPAAVAQPAAGETSIGFADSGVPHLVVRVPDADRADVLGRGRTLRNHPALATGGGANVDFISALPSGSWRMRTYERGVEGETLACGTGAVACGALLRAWGLAGDAVTIETTSGARLLVSIHETAGISTPSLAGEGRLVFEGNCVDL